MRAPTRILYSLCSALMRRSACPSPYVSWRPSSPRNLMKIALRYDRRGEERQGRALSGAVKAVYVSDPERACWANKWASLLASEESRDSVSLAKTTSDQGIARGAGLKVSAQSRGDGSRSTVDGRGKRERCGSWRADQWGRPGAYAARRTYRWWRPPTSRSATTRPASGPSTGLPSGASLSSARCVRAR